MRRLLVVGGILVLAIAVALAIRSRSLERNVTPSADVVSSPAAKQGASVAPQPSALPANVIRSALPKLRTHVVSQPSPFRLTASRERPDEVIREARSAAEQGDPEAMHVLGDALQRCKRADRRSNADIEKDAVKRSLDIETALKRGGADPAKLDADSAEWSAQEAAQKEATRDACANVSAADADKGIDWMERAMAAGSRDALHDYAIVAITSKFDPDVSTEERYRRMDLANDYLRDVLSGKGCDGATLDLLRQTSVDPTNAYLFGALEFDQNLAELMSSGAPAAEKAKQQAAHDDIVARFRLDAPADQRDAAGATANYLRALYCSG